MPLRLLIADDNATFRGLLRSLLQTREGWEVCGEAVNGAEAVAKTAELKPNIVILDLAMPVLDGIHAARQISATSTTIPILLYTMHGFASLEMEAQKAGIRRVVNKTDPPETLLTAIDEVLQNEPLTVAGALPTTPEQTGSGLANAPSDLPAATDLEGNSKPN